MVTEKNIIDAYLHLRETNNSIPDETLNFIKDTCLEKLKEKETIPYHKYYFIVKVSSNVYEEITCLLPSGTYMELYEEDNKHIVQIRTDVINLFIENTTEKYERLF